VFFGLRFFRRKAPSPAMATATAISFGEKVSIEHCLELGIFGFSISWLIKKFFFSIFTSKNGLILKICVFSTFWSSCSKFFPQMPPSKVLGWFRIYKASQKLQFQLSELSAMSATAVLKKRRNFRSFFLDLLLGYLKLNFFQHFFLPTSSKWTIFSKYYFKFNVGWF